MRTRTLTFIGLTVLALQAGGCSSSNSGSGTSGRTLTVGMVPWGGCAPLNVAEARGFWKDLGVEVTVNVYPDGQKMAGALRDKRTDISYDMMGTVVGLNGPSLKLRMLSETDWSNGGDKIVMKKGLDVKTLKSKNVGVYINQPSINYFLGKFLAEGGLKLADVTPVEFLTSTIDGEFTNGDFQLVVNYEPEVQKLLTPDANGEVVKTSADYAGILPEGFYGREDVLSTVPREDLVKFFRGWIRAVKWTQDPANKAEYFTILKTKTLALIGDLPDADVQGLLDVVSVHGGSQQLARNAQGGGLQTYLAELKTFLTDNAQPQATFDPATIFDNSAVLEALQAENIASK